MAWTDAMRKKAKATQRRNAKLRAQGKLPPVGLGKKKGKGGGLLPEYSKAIGMKDKVLREAGLLRLNGEIRPMEDADIPLDSIPDNRTKKAGVKKSVGRAEPLAKPTPDLQLIAQLIVAVAKELA